MKITCISLIAVLIVSFNSFTPADEDRDQVAVEMKHAMETGLLNVWYPKDVDTLYGGFLSDLTFDFRPLGPQDKMIVTQARHIWSNARAAERYPKDSWYKMSAQRGFYFLRDYFWDKRYGGFYTQLTRQGKIKPSSLGEKIAYGNAFGIYALAAYYRCSGDNAALQLAKEAFYWLEKHSHDPVHRGYFQHMQMDGTPVKRTAATPSDAETGYKDQNSSIHLLEAFTGLYEVWPDPLLALRLKEMLLLVRDIITAQKGNLVLFFQPDWTPVSFRDSSYSTILQHHNLDHVSFGHDVETAYLMQEASHALGIKNDIRTQMIAKRMVDHALKNGWDSTAGGFYDEAYYFKDSTAITVIKDSKNWWAQAEALNTLLRMSDEYPADSMQYFQKFMQQWQYVKTYLIDHKYGGWYSGGLDKEPDQKLAPKGNIWKGSYHVLRALINCIDRLQPDTVPPPVPRHLTVETTGTRLLLRWDKAYDDRQVSGYIIYKNGIKIGFTPLLSFSLPGTGVNKSDSFYIQSVDLAGNQSGNSEKAMF
ncbi:MAG: AGE family epimerase/isomerase [Bacteroidota bacterium]